MKKRLLTHVCCGSCCRAAVNALRDNYELVLFYYSPFASSQEDFNKTLKEIRAIARQNGCSVISKQTEIKDWEKDVISAKGSREKQVRCIACIDHTLDKSARLAEGIGIDSFTTTLAMQDPEAKIIAEEKRLKYNIDFMDLSSLSTDFESKNHSDCSCKLLNR